MRKKLAFCGGAKGGLKLENTPDVVVVSASIADSCETQDDIGYFSAVFEMYKIFVGTLFVYFLMYWDLILLYYYSPLSNKAHPYFFYNGQLCISRCHGSGSAYGRCRCQWRLHLHLQAKG